MKKLLALVLVLALVPCVALCTDGISSLLEQVASLDLLDLYALNNAVQLRLFEDEAAIDGVLVPPGVYKVGEDIPAGSYRITLVMKPNYSSSIFQLYDATGTRSFTNAFSSSQSNTIGKITLQDGDTIEITLGDLRFFTYTGLFN